MKKTILIILIILISSVYYLTGEVEQTEFKTSQPVYKNKTLQAQVIGDLSLLNNRQTTDVNWEIKNLDMELGGDFTMVLNFTPKPIPFIGGIIEILRADEKYNPGLGAMVRMLGIVPTITDALGYTDGRTIVITKKIPLNPSELREERVTIRNNDGVVNCYERVTWVADRGFFAVCGWNNFGYDLDGYHIILPTVEYIAAYKIPRYKLLLLRVGITVW